MHCFILESHLHRLLFICLRDLISRGWRGSAESAEGSNASNGKAFVKRVKLLIIDEIHLVGEERGAVLEAIVSRTRFISRVLKQEENGAGEGSDMEATRIIGLSTALENPMDIADWCVN
jgi:activating signal cointegrator complex subunit 3